MLFRKSPHTVQISTHVTFQATDFRHTATRFNQSSGPQPGNSTLFPLLHLEAVVTKL